MNLLTLPKSLQSYNPIPNGGVFYAPLWNPGLSGATFKTVDRYGHLCTNTQSLYTPYGRDLDGTDDIITILDNPTLSAISPISVIVWCQPDIVGSDRSLLSKDAAGTAREWWLQFNAANKLAFYQVNAAGAGTGYLQAIGTNTISADTFYCVGATWTGVSAISNIVLYWNGAVDTLTSNAKEGAGATAHDSAAPVEIGRSNADNAICFNGVIGEVWIYKRVLTVAEILHIYNTTKRRYA